MFRRLALPALCAVLLAGCSSGASSAPRTPGGSPAADASVTVVATPAADCTPARPQTAGDQPSSIESGGMARTYILHVPPAYEGTKALPLVLAFHPYSGTASFMNAYAKLPAESDAEGFVLVTPDGAGSPQQWNIAKYTAAADDVGFIRDLLATIDAQLCIDKTRTYAEGYSNGGGMAQLLACEMPDRIAAVGLVASTFTGCPSATPVIAFHGTLDPLLPFEGSTQTPGAPAGDEPPIRKEISDWARRIGCDGLATISRPAADVELSTYHRCTAGDGEALLYAIIGGGHTWPGASLDLPEVGVTSHEIDATTTIWQFFVQHTHTN
jgi:polyhydroxybutyrate depolymerase